MEDAHSVLLEISLRFNYGSHVSGTAPKVTRSYDPSAACLHTFLEQEEALLTCTMSEKIGRPREECQPTSIFWRRRIPNFKSHCLNPFHHLWTCPYSVLQHKSLHVLYDLSILRHLKSYIRASSSTLRGHRPWANPCKLLDPAQDSNNVSF